MARRSSCQRHLRRWVSCGATWLCAGRGIRTTSPSRTPLMRTRRYAPLTCSLLRRLPKIVSMANARAQSPLRSGHCIWPADLTAQRRCVCRRRTSSSAGRRTARSRLMISTDGLPWGGYWRSGQSQTPSAFCASDSFPCAYRAARVIPIQCYPVRKAATSTLRLTFCGRPQLWRDHTDGSALGEHEGTGARAY
jgi:hypothetical protein